MAWKKRAARFLIVGIPLVLVGSIAMYFVRGNIAGYLTIMTLVQFARGFALPAFQVVGFYDDGYRDAFAGIALTALFGPLLGGIIYSVVFGAISNAMGLDFSRSVLGLMGWTIISGAVLHLAFFGIDPALAPFQIVISAFSIGCGNIFTRAPMLVIYISWFFGGFFRPLDRN